MFRIFFIIALSISTFLFVDILIIYRLIALALSVGIILFLDFYLLRRVEFYKILTISILLGIFLFIITQVKNLLHIDFEMNISTGWSNLLLSYSLLLIFYSAVQMGASSIYFRKIEPPGQGPVDGSINILDTCTIIDGRFQEASKSGFMPESIVIPEFVIRELQLISDSSIHEKRVKGRRGLDCVKSMKNSDNISIQIISEDYPDMKGVDNKLLQLAKDKDGRIITTDYNLIKVAQVEGVKVLNVNELAYLLRPPFNINDKIKVSIIKKGNNKNQGIGFLEDDTMVVIEEAERYIGSSKLVIVTSYIQNISGRIAFCKLV